MSVSTAPSATSSAWRSLRVRNYRLYWLAQVASQLGIWMRLIGLSWLVLDDLGGGGTVIGFIAAAQFVPTLLLGPWAGLLADRRSPHLLLRITQTSMVVLNVVFFVTIAAGWLEVWMVYGFATATGIIVAFDNPSRQAMVGELVGPELVANAVALNAVGFNGARIVGPAIAGGLIAVGGPQLCFAIVSIAYVVALVGFLAIDVERLAPRERTARAKRQIREGFRYAWSVDQLRSTLVVLAVVGTLSMNFTVLVPLLATSVTSSAGTFGLVSTSLGVGSLVGSVLVARRSAATMAHLAAAAGGLAFGMTMVAILPGAWLVVALPVTGLCSITFLTTTNSLLQLGSRPELRGRVVSLYTVLVVGTSPLGGPLVGWIAEQRGVRTSVGLGAAGAAIGAAIAGVAALRAGTR